ncbi:hypothetical protein SPD48_07740 [Pseudogracilibacillus sp. SE30717A]
MDNGGTLFLSAVTAGVTARDEIYRRVEAYRRFETKNGGTLFLSAVTAG